MSTLSEQVKTLRAKRDLTQDDFAKILGTNRATLANWETGRTEPDTETIKRISRFFGISIDCLISGQDFLTTRFTVPLLGPIRAGVPILSDDNYTETVTPPEGVRADFASPVEGDSMIYAGIHPGDIAFFCECAEPRTGQIVAARVVDIDAAVNLKFFVQKNGQAVLRSANPGYADIPFTENHAVVGVMTGLIRDGAPVLNDYERLLITTETINQKWTSAVNEAIADGISPEQFSALLGMMKQFINKV